MTSDAEPFDYEALFSRSTPSEPGRRQAHARYKYDFGVAYPDPDTVPLEGLAEGLRVALAEEGRDLAVYPHPQGYPPLREFVADKIAEDRDIHVSPDDIIVADGSSQPNYMIAEALLDAGDVVLTEDFTYQGTLQILRRFKADIRGVPCDDEGMLPDALDAAIKTAGSHGKRVKFIYTIPTFQNPQGWVMTPERRRAMVALSQRYGVPIVEDDCYVDLRYEGEPVSSIHSLDEAGLVIYVASFSKIIGPGMRLGYLTAPPQVLDRIAAVKSGGGVSQFAALAVHRYATQHLKQDVAARNDVLRIKRDAMLAALGESFGSAATWSRPPGGLFIWLRMPEGADTGEVHEKAAEAGVSYGPGIHLSPEGSTGNNYARLCFGYNRPEEIHEGIAKLADVFESGGLLGA